MRLEGTTRDELQLELIDVFNQCVKAQMDSKDTQFEMLLESFDYALGDLSEVMDTCKMSQKLHKELFKIQKALVHVNATLYGRFEGMEQEKVDIVTGVADKIFYPYLSSRIARGV